MTHPTDTNVRELKEEFFYKFARNNKSSQSEVWWKVPSIGEPEIADPVQVWRWIEDKLHE